MDVEGHRGDQAFVIKQLGRAEVVRSRASEEAASNLWLGLSFEGRRGLERDVGAGWVLLLRVRRDRG